MLNRLGRRRVVDPAKLEKKAAQRDAAARRRERPGARGWMMRGGGATTVVDPAVEWRGTTVQVCGLWPWAVGAGAPMVGVPLGRHLFTSATVCCDPISWFQRAHLISNPSVFCLGLPGRGKSTMVRRMALGLSGFGTMPLVLGDTKPDYVDMVRALGGQVITLGRGRGHLNVLDPGESLGAIRLLREHGFVKEADELAADMHGRRLTIISALLTIQRKQPPSDLEEALVDQALHILDENADRVPVLADLLEVIQSARPELREIAVDRGDLEYYKDITRKLEQSLFSLARGGRLGDTFAHPTSEPMLLDRPVVYDVSSISETDDDLRAAVLLACWSNGFGHVTVANTLADAGLAPRRHYFVILDELWRALQAGSGMVSRVDSLTRLNRQWGVGMAMVTHTMSDLDSLPDEHDRHKARGLVERSGMVIAGGLSQAEMPLLNSAIRLSKAEENLLVSWQDPPAWDSRGNDAAPPGRGKFLIKVGGRPGIPIDVQLTSVEASAGINDTNKLWHQASRVGERQSA